MRRTKKVFWSKIGFEKLKIGRFKLEEMDSSLSWKKISLQFQQNWKKVDLLFTILNVTLELQLRRFHTYQNSALKETINSKLFATKPLSH